MLYTIIADYRIQPIKKKKKKNKYQLRLFNIKR